MHEKEGRTARDRKAPLTAETWVALMLHYERTKWQGQDQPVFAGNTGMPMDGHNVLVRSFRAAAKRIGAPWATWHTLRHTSATLADKCGLSVAEKQKLLGHRDAEMTTRYTHPEIERVREALEKIGMVQ